MATTALGVVATADDGPVTCEAAGGTDPRPGDARPGVVR